MYPGPHLNLSFQKVFLLCSLSLIVLAISLVNQGVGRLDFFRSYCLKWDEGVKTVTENTIKEALLVIN